MSPYWWLSEQDYQWCVSAQEDWRRRLPAIKANSLKTLEKWRAETEHTQRWALCDW